MEVLQAEELLLEELLLEGSLTVSTSGKASTWEAAPGADRRFPREFPRNPPWRSPGAPPGSPQGGLGEAPRAPKESFGLPKLFHK